MNGINDFYNTNYQNNSLITFIPVSGINQVNSWPVTAGASVKFMDTNEPKFYIKSVDITGVVQPLKIYEFKEIINTPTAEPEYVTKEDLEKALSELRKNDFKKGNK